MGSYEPHAEPEHTYTQVENLCYGRQPVLLAQLEPATIGRDGGRGVGTRGENP